MARFHSLGQSTVGGFLPWIVYWVIASGPSSWKDGTWAAFVCAVLLYGDEFAGRNKRQLNISDAVTVLFFGALSVVAFILDRSDIRWIEDYSQTISAGVLAVGILGSLLFKVRFTEAYARADTPREYWDSPVFKRVNRDLTVMWGVAMTVIAVIGYVAAHNHTHGALLGWVLPAIILVGTFKAGSRYPQWLMARLGPPDGADPAPAGDNAALAPPASGRLA